MRKLKAIICGAAVLALLNATSALACETSSLDISRELTLASNEYGPANLQVRNSVKGAIDNYAANCLVYADFATELTTIIDTGLSQAELGYTWAIIEYIAMPRNEESYDFESEQAKVDISPEFGQAIRDLYDWTCRKAANETVTTQEYNNIRRRIAACRKRGLSDAENTYYVAANRFAISPSLFESETRYMENYEEVLSVLNVRTELVEKVEAFVAASRGLDESENQLHQSEAKGWNDAEWEYYYQMKDAYEHLSVG